MRSLFFIALFTSFLIACSDDGSGAADADTSLQNEEKALTADRWFQYQEEFNVGDSMQAVVLGWGAVATGNYIVMLADSTHENYIATTQYRKGIIQDVWVEDLDEDGWPEVIVSTQSAGTGAYGEILVHELEAAYSFGNYSLPQLTETLGADYQGHDAFFVEGNHIVREFRLYDDAMNKKREWRRIFYELEGDRMVVRASEDLEDL